MEPDGMSTEAELVEATCRLIEENAKRMRASGNPVEELMADLLGERGNGSCDVQNPQMVWALRQAAGPR